MGISRTPRPHPMRPMGILMRPMVIALLALLLAGCAELLPVGPQEVVSETSDELFLLVVRSPTRVYAPGEPIDVAAEVLYQGPKNAESIYHASSPVGWQIRQVDGPAVMGGGMDMPCLTTDLTAGQPTRYPFQKAGVVEDNGPFDRAWFEQRNLTLPAGRWRVIATFDVALADCGGESHHLEASIDLVVEP